MDLHTRFEQFGGDVETAPAATVDADVLRGRRAVRRRRTGQAVLGSALGVGVIGACAFIGVGGGGSGAVPQRQPAVAQHSATGSQVAPGGLRLVDYRGPQPEHFTVDKVPAGFFIQDDDYGGLTIAPDAVKNPGPDVDPSKSPMYDPHDLTGKIGIFLESREFRGEVDGDQLTVAGHPAVLHRIGPTTQLLIAVSPRVWATLQFDVPLSREQMLELGAGLQVHQDLIDRMGAPIVTHKKD